MTHKNILTEFGKLFPTYSNVIEEWFPNGKNSVRLRLSESHEEFIFTCSGPLEWKFETVKNYLEGMSK